MNISMNVSELGFAMVYEHMSHQELVSSMSGNQSLGPDLFQLAGPTSSRVRYVQSACLFFFFFLALGGNCAVVYRLWRGRVHSGAKKLSNISLLYLQLSIADLVAAFCCILSNAILYLVQHFVAGNGLCKLLRFLQKLGVASSTFIVMAIGLDRCLAVLFPMRRALLRKVVKVMIALAWIFGALLSLPQLFIFQVNIFVSDEGAIFQCDNSAGFSAAWQETGYDLMYLILLYITPIIVIAFCYGKIIRAMGVQVEEAKNVGLLMDPKTSPLAANSRRCRFEHARQTSLKVSIWVISTFMICWAPYYGSLLYHVIHRPAPHEDYYFNHAIYFCGLGHSVINPILYGAYHFFQRHRADQRASGSSESRRRSMSSTMSRITGVNKLLAYHSLRRSPIDLTV